MGVGDALVGEQLDVLLHESLHSLGLNSWMYARYVDDSGATMGESRVLMTDADGKPWLTTPRVTAAARAWYGCDTMPGMRLEDNGGAGTAMSHWEKSLVGNELMAGSTDGDRMVLSALTLAHLSDTGWYTADMLQARTSGYGRDAGCDWVADPCTPGRKYCQKADYGETRESYDEHKYGVCQEMDLEPACPEVVMLRRGACYDGFNNSSEWLGEGHGAGDAAAARCPPSRAAAPPRPARRAEQLGVDVLRPPRPGVRARVRSVLAAHGHRHRMARLGGLPGNRVLRGRQVRVHR